MRTATAVVIALAKPFLLILLLPMLIATYGVVGHQIEKAVEEFGRTAENYDAAFPESMTPHTVEKLDIGLVREIGQEMDVDVEGTLERLRQLDGGFWLYVAQSEIFLAMQARLAGRIIAWSWIGISIKVVLIALGYVVDRKLKAPQSAEARWEAFQPRPCRLVRRYFPLLMILLAAVYLGISISTVRRISVQSAVEENRTGVMGDCRRIVADARQWYRKSVDLGGGGESWSELSFDALPVGSSTPNGSYGFTLDGAVLTVTGTGAVEDSEGKVARVTLTYDAATDSLVSPPTSRVMDELLP